MFKKLLRDRENVKKASFENLHMKTSPEMKFILMGLVPHQLFQRREKKSNLKTQQKKLFKIKKKKREKKKFSNEKNINELFVRQL